MIEYLKLEIYRLWRDFSFLIREEEEIFGSNIPTFQDVLKALYLNLSFIFAHPLEVAILLAFLWFLGGLITYVFDSLSSKEKEVGAKLEEFKMRLREKLRKEGGIFYFVWRLLDDWVRKEKKLEWYEKELKDALIKKRGKDE